MIPNGHDILRSIKTEMVCHDFAEVGERLFAFCKQVNHTQFDGVGKGQEEGKLFNIENVDVQSYLFVASLRLIECATDFPLIAGRRGPKIFSALITSFNVKGMLATEPCLTA